jgi:hypothetical protein
MIERHDKMMRFIDVLRRELVQANLGQEECHDNPAFRRSGCDYFGGNVSGLCKPQRWRLQVASVPQCAYTLLSSLPHRQRADRASAR